MTTVIRVDIGSGGENGLYKNSGMMTVCDINTNNPERKENAQI